MNSSDFFFILKCWQNHLKFKVRAVDHQNPKRLKRMWKNLSFTFRVNDMGENWWWSFLDGGEVQVLRQEIFFYLCDRNYYVWTHSVGRWRVAWHGMEALRTLRGHHVSVCNALCHTRCQQRQRRRGFSSTILALEKGRKQAKGGLDWFSSTAIIVSSDHFSEQFSSRQTKKLSIVP